MGKSNGIRNGLLSQDFWRQNVDMLPGGQDQDQELGLKGLPGWDPLKGRAAAADGESAQDFFFFNFILFLNFT